MSGVVTYYKVLNANGMPCHGGSGAWSLPRGREPGAWRREKGPIELCEPGTLHLCRSGDLVYWLGPAIFVAEARGEVVEGDNKIGCLEARLISRTAWDDRAARLFAADCAARALCRLDRPDPRSIKAVRVARRYAVGKATAKDLGAASAAVWGANSEVAWVAAWATTQNIAQNSTTAWAAAWAAARDAARDAARGSAADAAASAANAAAAEAAEYHWQTQRLLRYLNGETPRPVPLPKVAP